MKKIIFIVSILFTILISNAQCVFTLAGSGVQGFANGNGTLTQFNLPFGVAVDISGNVYVADSQNSRIRKISPAGLVTTLAGSTFGYADGVGTSAQFYYPNGVAVDGTGNVYVTDSFNHRIRKITPQGIVSTIAGSGVAGFANGTGVAAQFNYPRGIVIDSSGNLYIADTSNHRIRKITSTGVVTTIAGSGIAGLINSSGTSARFNNPRGVTIDNFGNIYVADSSNHCIRKITPSGSVTTFAGTGTIGSDDGVFGRFNQPYGVACDSSGLIYVADSFNNKIRKINSLGIVSTFAGTGVAGYDTSGSTIQFNRPSGICFDSSQNIYIGDYDNQRIRKIPNLIANINYLGSPFCKSLTASQSVSLNGTGPYTGGSFSSTTGLTINSVTGSITPNTSTAGTYTVTYSTPSVSGCPSVSTTTQITITAIPTATINYTGSPFCKSITTGQPVTLTGTGAYTGGTYSSTTGLSINASTGAINPSLSTAGTYTVTYTTPSSGGCAAVSTTRQVTITAQPTATLNYSGSPFCKSLTTSQSVTLTGIGAYLGGTYSSTTGLSINASTGAINPSLSTAGTYTVTYTIPASGGCALVTSMSNVTILPLNTVTLPSSTPTLCINTPLPFITHTTTGATNIGTPTGLPTGVTSTWAANTITISGIPTVSGIFNYSIPLTGGCGTYSATGSITILPVSSSSISADGTTATNITINSGNVVQLQLNGSLGTPANIQWSPSVGISSTSISNPLVYPSTTTTYTASFVNNNGCTQTTSFTVNVTPQPNIGTISLSSSNSGTIGLFDTITVNVQLTNATDLYSLYMKLKGNAAVSQYLDYSTYTAGNLLGTSNVISTPPTVTNGVPDFGMTKVGAAPGYSGTGLFYTFKFVPKNISIPDGTVFCFYLDDVNTYNSTATTCGLTNQGQICFTFSNQIKVWPGDLNNSNVVTTADLLPIGYFYNSTGPVRPNATIQWNAQPATLWGFNRSTMSGSAYKTFADSNGDGVINNADQAAIGFNMNQVHTRQANRKPFGIAPNTSNNAQVQGALNVTPNVSIINGAVLPQTVTFTVNLTNTGGLSSLYGISVNLIFDNTIFDLSTATINYTGSIFGNVGTDCLAMNYNSASGVSVGLTRYANAAINGQGLLFKVTLQTKTTLPNLAQTQVTSYVDAANNQLGNPLEIGDSTPINFSVINVNLSLNDIVLNTFKLYPNPSKGILYFSVGDSYLDFQELKLKIVNTLGQVIDQISVKNSTEEIITKNWGSSGLYFVQIETTQGEILGIKKIILQ
jgi:sugar lactone lactonase YvrE